MKIEIKFSPLEYAQSLTAAELKKVIKTIKSGEYDEYSDRCRVCFEKYLAGNMDEARWWSNHAEIIK